MVVSGDRRASRLGPEQAAWAPEPIERHALKNQEQKLVVCWGTGPQFADASLEGSGSGSHSGSPHAVTEENSELQRRNKGSLLWYGPRSREEGTSNVLQHDASIFRITKLLRMETYPISESCDF
jgi:hypothetical protein